MRPIAIRYVRDVDAARAFYEALGMTRDYSQRPTRRGLVMWVELTGDGGTLALHSLPDEDGATIADSTGSATGKPGVTPGHSAVELSFESQEPLERVTGRLRQAGYPLETEIVDETFGRSFRVRDPEGLVIQVNENDRTL
jgi:catechol 2,3-dioxygenase-like lactoylglutathione lyase family enzyme